MTRPFDAIIFDLDGTLVDSAPDIADCLNEHLETYGVPSIPLGDVRMMIGGGVRKLLERAWQSSDIETPSDLDDQVASFIEIYRQRPMRRSMPYLAASYTLAALHARNITLGLCTNKPEAITRSMLQTLEWISMFSSIVGGDTTPARKPDPLPIRVSLERMNRRAERTLYVGDSIHDLEAARAANLRCILVSHGYSAVPVATLGADDVIDELSELLNKLD